MGSLQTRLLLSYVLVAGLVLGLLAASLVVFLAASPIAVRQTYQRMQFAGATLAEREPRGLLGQGAVRIRQLLGRLDLDIGRMIIVDSGGAVLGDSTPEQAPPPDPVLAEAVRSEAGRGEYDLGGETFLYTHTPMDGGRGLLLVVPRPGLRLGTLFGDDLARPFLQAGVIALGVSLVLAWVMARSVAAPMERLGAAARRVAAGDLRPPDPIGGPAEVQSLAAAFAEMVEKVRAGQQAQRDFVANISHELRTPLTSIQGFAQAILDGAAGDPAGVRRAGRVILEEAERLRRLVEDLLELARLDARQIPLERAAVDLAAVVGGVVESLGLRAGERQVRLTVDLTTLPTIIGDGERLAQVFTNLIDNALRHSSAGQQVVVRGSAQGGGVTISVQDSGPGIPPEELSRIFERFYQVDKARAGGAGRGTGLGLAISKEIVEAHGGRIVAESIEGVGSRFSVRLPTALPDDTTAARPRPRL